MTKNERNRQPGLPAYSCVDEILHALALAMARQQMERAWPAATAV